MPGTRTAIVVRIDSEIPLASVHAQVGDGGCEACAHDFALEGEGAVLLPFSFVIAPRGGDASREVQLLVQGRDSAGTIVVTRTVRTQFRAGRAILLNVLLEGACLARACEPGTTCAGGDCVDDTVDAGTLPEIAPGQELALDGGARDGDAGKGRDAGISAPRDCVEVRDRGMTEVGLYTIDPDGSGGDDPFVAMCDPVSDGGGWALIANVLPRSETLGFDGAAWEADETAANAMPSTALGAEHEGLFLPYWRLPVDSLRIVLVDPASGTPRVQLASLSSSPITVREAMRAPTPVELSPTAAEWATVVGIPDVSELGACAISRIGARMDAARVRIGAVLADPSMAMACDPTALATAWLGVGAAQDARGGCTAVASPPIASGGSSACVRGSARFSLERQGLVWGRAGG